ncbi:MAG: histidinol-phosphate transaminase [Bacteroidota bacterium]|nr:histidinol-phosphate transaminase [Bacteroidota bacterium]
MSEIKKLVRENILNLKPYSSARDEYSGQAGIFLDANENSLGSTINENVNRYPDPYQRKVKDKISAIKGIPSENIFLGNGSDEVIDLLIRAFCYPGKDEIIIMPPTYGMYSVSAEINNVGIKEVFLTSEYDMDVDKVLASVTDKTKLIFICSPNNPTGNCLKNEDIKRVINTFNGLVILDEAYIDFSEKKSFLKSLLTYPNLVIMQTFSKAWGLAGIRLGMAFADKFIIDIMNKIKPPYNVNELTQKKAIEALNNLELKNRMVDILLKERELLEKQLTKFDFVEKVYPTDSNFILVKTLNANKIYDYLVNKSIIVRNRSNISLCLNCLRITVGTKEENKLLIEALENY